MINYYEEAIKRPFSNITKLIIGILLSILPIVNLIVGGYTLECAKTAFKKRYALPDWKNIPNLFVQGVLIAVVELVYIIPGMIFLMIGGAGIIKDFLSLSSTKGLSFGSLFFTSGPLLIISFLLFLLAMYVVPIAILNYGIKNKFSKAFEISSVFKKAFTTTYLFPWIITAIYMLIVISILGLIPIIGSAIGSFIATVTGFTIFGSVYKDIKR